MTTNQNKVHTTAKTVATKQPWEQMKLTYVGHIDEIVQVLGQISLVGGGGPLDL